jgi:hypothetical protein
VERRDGRSLRSNELAGHSGDEAAAALVAEVAEKDDELGVIGGECRNVIPLVVGICAREGLASRDGLVAG